MYVVVLMFASDLTLRAVECSQLVTLRHYFSYSASKDADVGADSLIVRDPGSSRTGTT